MKILRIFKIGGNVITEASELNHFLKDFSSIRGQKILVHGGGKRVSELSRKLGLEVKMVEGRRITDAATLEIVKMVLPGLVNKNIVADLQAFGCNAIGLTGADGDLIRAEKRPLKDGHDYGYVGNITRVSGQAISQLLDLSLIPVFTAMTHDGNGQLYNTNADTIASVLAIEMSKYYAVELYYCFEKQGVLKDLTNNNSLIKKITSENYPELKSAGLIHSGMIPKIDTAFEALHQGVKKIYICHYAVVKSITEGVDAGTLISA